MPKLALTFILILSFQFPALAQEFPNMIYIPGGTTILGGGYQYEIVDYRMQYLGRDLHFDSLNAKSTVIGEIPGPNNPQLQVSISSYLLAQTEVTNRQYRDFLADSLLEEPKKSTYFSIWKKNKKSNLDELDGLLLELFAKADSALLLPDTACWTRDFKFSYNSPLANHYFQHPAFDEYPVVGVSWEQAKAYCAWLSRANNAARAKKKLPPAPDFRLPTEMEWEYAALGMIPDESDPTRRIYPWQGTRPVDEKRNYLANMKTGHGDYFEDGYMYTSAVTAFPPNDFGLYAMAGNASEWVEDVFRVNPMPTDRTLIEVTYGGIDRDARVVKGGSWADYYPALMCGSRTGFPQEKGSSRIGFRVAQIIAVKPFEY